MWVIKRHELQMTEGDYGVELPIKVKGTTLTSSDTLELIIKDKNDGEVIIDKTFSNIENNRALLSLTSSESELLSVGNYIYRIDWYQNGLFMCNLIPSALLRVVNKA